MKYAADRPYSEKAADTLLEIARLADLATLDHSLIVKPSIRIETLGDAIRFLATLTSEVRAQLHWYRAIHSLGIAVDEPRYVTVATLNLQMALAMDHLLCEPDRRLPEKSPPA